MKKGLSYVDIALSIGIFLIYLIIAFIILKPSIKEENIATLLLPSLKDNFESFTFSRIHQYPIFLYATDSMPGYELIVPFNLKSEQINFLDKDFNIKPFFYESILVNNKPAFRLIFEENSVIINEKKPYYILQSDDFNLVHLTSPTTNLAPTQSYNYTFGVQEEFVGISINEFNKLLTYFNIKSKFNFPFNNDFGIFIYDDTSKQPILNYSTAVRQIDVPVYSLQYTSFILYDNTTRMPVLVLLQVW